MNSEPPAFISVSRPPPLPFFTLTRVCLPLVRQPSPAQIEDTALLSDRLVDILTNCIDAEKMAKVR